MSTTRQPGLRRVARVGVVTSAIAIGSIVALALPAAAAQPPVGLGTATSFAVLAGSGITNTGPTTVTGDIGTFPTPSETGFGAITQVGTNHAGDAVTAGAKDALVTAYDDAFGRTPATNVPVELGGSTLAAGVYTSPTFGLTGTLTLDAAGDPNAQFIFQAASTLITESNSRVLLVNGANACQVVWQVGSSATFKTGTSFVGNVLALTSITAQTAATFQGRLLARNGAVTLDTNTITNAACAIAGGGGGSGTPADVPPGTDQPGVGAGVPGAGAGVPGEDAGNPPSLAFSGSPATERAQFAGALVGIGVTLHIAGLRHRRRTGRS